MITYKRLFAFGLLGAALYTPIKSFNVTHHSALTPLNSSDANKVIDKRNNIPFTHAGRSDGFPVVIIDSGLDYTHKDLAPVLHKNSQTTPITINNSIVSNDTYGWDFNENDNKSFDNSYSYTPQFVALPKKDDEKNYYSKLAEALLKNTVEIIRMVTPIGAPGHGSHVAGIVISQCKSCSLVPVKIFGEQTISLQMLVNAIEYTQKRGYKLVNMSLGIDTSLLPKDDTPLKDDAPKKQLDAAMELIKKNKNILFVIAAGNSGAYLGKDIEIYPAQLNLPNVITVGAIDNNNVLAQFSNFSPEYVDVFAPGVDILSTWNDGGYNKISGTSMSAPMVTGIIGQLWSQNPNLNVEEVVQLFFQHTKQLSIKFKDTPAIMVPAILSK